ncbi:MAG: hypothetical protein NQU46_06650 [Methanolinea sp.]|nr:hypothetical protein [Methanolinea sp.]
MKKAVLFLFLCISLVGITSADDPVNATYETMGITTSTSVVVYGTFSEVDTIVWQQSSGGLADNPPLGSSERMATMSYSETTLANNGYVEYNKGMNLDTGQKAANQGNFRSVRQMDFESFEDAFGSVISEESLLLDTVSTGSSSADRVLCPWSSGTGTIPAYCNIIEMGSSFSGTSVSLTTTAMERHISLSADVPAGMEYTVDLSGRGAASAWIRAHLQEGRGETDKGMDLVYSEKTAASGVIASFSKAMSYQSGIRRF